MTQDLCIDLIKWIRKKKQTKIFPKEGFNTVDGSEIQLTGWYGKSPIIYMGSIYMLGYAVWDFFHEAVVQVAHG